MYNAPFVELCTYLNYLAEIINLLPHVTTGLRAGKTPVSHIVVDRADKISFEIGALTQLPGKFEVRTPLVWDFPDPSSFIF